MTVKLCAVDAPQAAANLAQLLERVERGEEIVITRNGAEVAHLIPPSRKSAPAETKATIARLRQARRGVTLGGLGLRELIDEGRA